MPSRKPIKYQIFRLQENGVGVGKYSPGNKKLMAGCIYCSPETAYWIGEECKYQEIMIIHFNLYIPLVICRKQFERN